MASNIGVLEKATAIDVMSSIRSLFCLGTYRARGAERMGKPPLRTMNDLADCAREAVELGYTAFKTNLIFPGDPANVIAQGFRGPVHDQTATTELIRHAEAQIGAMRDAVGPDIDIWRAANL